DAVHRALVGLVDDAHAAFADLLLDLVLAQQVLELDVAGLLDEEVLDLADADAVAEGELPLGDLLAIEVGAVARAEVDQAVELAVAPDLAVHPARHVVEDLDIAGRLATHGRDVLAQRVFMT